MLSYLNGDQFGGDKGDGADVWEIGGTGTWGNNTLVVAYGEKDNTSGGVGEEAVADQFGEDFGKTETFEIVGVHSLSKRTAVYGGYINRSFDGYFFNSNGQKKNFSDQEIVTVGMKHKF